MGHQRVADHGAGGRGDLVCRARDLDPARLAAPAGVDLCLDRPGRAAELPRRLDRLRGGIGDPSRQDGDAEASQQLFRLIFVDVHGSYRLVAYYAAWITRFPSRIKLLIFLPFINSAGQATKNSPRGWYKGG